MIFVTVGTHEQQFNRLVKYIDNMVKCGRIKERVIIQSGFSTYNPEYCDFKKIIPYTELIENIREARIVITHGGPATFIMPLQFGKIPVVVPRRKKFDEHVNDHQFEFAKMVEKKQGNIILVEDIGRLMSIIDDYEEIVKKMPNKIIKNNVNFNKNLKSIINELV